MFAHISSVYLACLHIFVKVLITFQQTCWNALLVKKQSVYLMFEVLWLNNSLTNFVILKFLGLSKIALNIMLAWVPIAKISFKLNKQRKIHAFNATSVESGFVGNVKNLIKIITVKIGSLNLMLLL